MMDQELDELINKIRLLMIEGKSGSIQGRFPYSKEECAEMIENYIKKHTSRKDKK